MWAKALFNLAKSLVHRDLAEYNTRNREKQAAGRYYVILPF